jgi:MoaA/NifB/PqqE/SkfB family radical SAM enzyme
MSTAVAQLTPDEIAKRNGLMARKPYVAKKLARISAIEEAGGVNPIIRLEKSYLCNFQCTHCSAEYYMDRHLGKVLHVTDQRQKMDLDDVRRLSREADELGLARFVITGGEPLVMQDFDAVVEALDPERHYIITDTNGWFLDAARAKHLKEIGVEKVQLSLDSFIEADHDRFRNKPGAYRHAMVAIDAALDAGLNLILSTVLVRGRAGTAEFRDLCEFSQRKGIGLYVSYAKPTGSCTKHPEFVITKEDADIVRELEKTYKVFTHMTPSYGSYKGCIANKGIITVTSTMEITPCPYIDFSLGNLRQTSLRDILARGQRNPWLGPYRPDCLIGEDPAFIRRHTEVTAKYQLLPVPWGEGFSDTDALTGEAPATVADGAWFDAQGRLVPTGVSEPVHATSRRYFQLRQPRIDYAGILARTTATLGGTGLPSAIAFRDRIDTVLRDLAADPATRDLLHGVYVPFVLPQAAHDDIGTALDQRYLPAVAQACAAMQPAQTFVNHHQTGLVDRLRVGGGRHDRLIRAMAAGPVVGVYFPALSEYGIPAARARVAALPERFLLAGGYDTCAALIAAPDLLRHDDRYPPVLWLAGLDAEKAEANYHFEAYGRDLTFNRRVHFGQAAESWCSGLVVLG